MNRNTVFKPTITDIFGDIDRVFDYVLSNGQSNQCQTAENSRTRRAVSDFYEDKDQYIIKAELPGVKKKEINLDVDGKALHLTASRQEKKGEEEVSYTFERTFTLPEDVDLEKLGAAFEDGVLTVTLPKEEAKKPLKIEVK